MLAILKSWQEPPHFEPEPSTEHEPSVVPEPCCIHDGQVWYVYVCSWNGRRISFRWYCCECIVAEDRLVCIPHKTTEFVYLV